MNLWTIVYLCKAIAGHIFDFCVRYLYLGSGNGGSTFRKLKNTNVYLQEL